MIAFVQGLIKEKFPTHIVIENNGIGLELLVPFSTFDKCPEIDQHAKLLTHLYVREDAIILFGFATLEERELFRDLISVSGIGPKLAIGILSRSSVSNVYQLINDGDETGLTQIKGLGKKTAQRMILDLKDRAQNKMKGVTTESFHASLSSNQVTEQTKQAMMSLGYSKNEAEKAILKAINKIGNEKSVEELVRAALSGD